MILPTNTPGSAWKPPTPGYVPNYGAILAQDPGYIAAQANAGLSNGMAASNRDAAIAALQYGYNGAGNRFSDVAQANRAYQQAELTGTNSLAGRGMLGSTPGMSGEKSWMDKNLEYQKGLSIYGAGRSMAAQAMAALAAYLGTAQNSASSVADAAGSAYGRALQNGLYVPWSPS